MCVFCFLVLQNWINPASLELCLRIAESVLLAEVRSSEFSVEIKVRQNIFWPCYAPILTDLCVLKTVNYKLKMDNGRLFADVVMLLCPLTGFLTRRVI